MDRWAQQENQATWLSDPSTAPEQQLLPPGTFNKTQPHPNLLSGQSVFPALKAAHSSDPWAGQHLRSPLLPVWCLPSGRLCKEAGQQAQEDAGSLAESWERCLGSFCHTKPAAASHSWTAHG
ncbi:hypothetical protein P7K49_040233 [Saguinus oedipus]|uniref:Uncharacterized protein n=1 Tax=Saguinus oedipus TaxID=9490 RepID=A0ABQ9T8Q1_SAGOE|nr:hypothetical protein P7K49_040233 [Saguinus oedipus]